MIPSRVAWPWAGLLLLLPSWAAQAQYSICVDPGHGGTDPGAVGCGLEEDAINLDTSLRLRDLLQANGLSVVMTRSTDVNVGLSSRSDYANSQGVDRFVSIHSNAADPPGTGIETYCAVGASSYSFDLRDRIQAEMVATWPLRNRGGKTANFSVLVNTDMPATLSELAFINMCSPDAEYLSDPAQRQRAAEAHLRAILGHLGVQPTSKGTLRGVVFEDLGSGTADMSVRLPGATVRVVQTGDSQSAVAGTADWAFELDAGSYTAEASLAGFQTGSRACDVQANQTTWCSIGLFRESPPDAGEPDAADEEPVADEEPAAEEEPTAEEESAEDGGPDGANDAGADEETEDVGGGCGCGSSGGSSAGLGLLFGLAVLGGRRPRAWLLVLAAVGLLGTARAAEPLEQALVGQETVGARLIGEQRVVGGEYGRPALSPDGNRLLFTRRAGGDGLFVRELATGLTRQLSAARGAGLAPVWSADGARVGLRPAAAPFAAPSLTWLGLDGRAAEAPPAGGQWLEQRGEEIWLVSLDLQTRLAGGSDGGRCFAPLQSADGRFGVWGELTSGLHLVRLADGARFALGPGNHPAFSPDGALLVFDRTADDGHLITSGDLWLVDLRAAEPRLAPLTSTPGRIETHPSLSRLDRGRARLAFEAGDTVLTAELVID